MRRHAVRLLIVAAVAGITAVVAAPSAGGPVVPDRALAAVAGPLPVSQDKCVSLIQRQGAWTLVNACASCRTAKVERKRPGTAVPVNRSYTLPARARAPLGFKGPGRTRLTLDAPCAGAGAPKAAAALSDPVCARLARTQDGVPALVNTCDACRTVVVERLGPGTARSTQQYAIEGRAHVRLASKGAAGVRLVGERQCRAP